MKGLTPHELTMMLVALGLLIGFARVFGELARSIHQPAVLGELLAGVLLGPTVFGTLWPELQQHIFPREGPIAVVLEGISSFAIVLFLLVAGLEVDLSTVWKQGRPALKVGILGTLIPFLAGLAGACWMPVALGRQVEADPVIFALFLATAMSISALPVIARILMDLNLYRTDLGMVVVSAAIFNDLIGWTVFALILGMLGTNDGQFSVPTTILLTLVFGTVMLTAGRWLIHRILPLLQTYTRWPGGVLGFSIACTLFGAAFTEYIGVHAIFGAFVVGVALGSTPHMQERTRIIIEEFGSLVFAPVYFAGIGLKVNFVEHFDPALVASVFILACLGKLLGAVPGALWGKLSRRDAWAVGFAMNARGAMEIILGLLALQAGVIRPPLFVALVIMALGTSAFSGPLIRWILRQNQVFHIQPLLCAKCFQGQLQASTRREAISELVALACSESNLIPQTINQLAWDREELEPTGIGNGVAIPHARVPQLTQSMIVVGLSQGGVDFDAPDGQPAHIIFLLLVPEDDPAALLEISANIARIFRDPIAQEQVLRTRNYDEFLAVMRLLNTADRTSPPASSR